MRFIGEAEEARSEIYAREGGAMSEVSFYDILIEEIMNCNPPLIEKSASIYAVAKKVGMKRRHVWVVEGKDSRKLVGVITEKDLLDVISPLPFRSYTIGVISPRCLHHTELEKAEDIMAGPVIKCHPKTTIEEALRLMVNHRIRRLAVTENDEIIGELSLTNVIHAYFSI
ncbi:MAG TPA: CBS domain-containing protein [Dehalococcoidia bacterium]|nr:CBS domain-containing protein [Dehalococcoidia bacterium]